MHEDVHDVLVDFASQPVLGPPGEDDKLDSQQRHQDERGPHGLHVHVGLGSVRVAQFGHQHADDVQQEEEVHLPSSTTRSGESITGGLKKGTDAAHVLTLLTHKVDKKCFKSFNI